MQVQYTAKFSKDLDKVSGKEIKSQIAKCIEAIKAADKLSDLANLKKMKGAEGAYRIRIGDYRLGFYYIDGIVKLARFSHRKDIYKYFP